MRASLNYITVAFKIVGVALAGLFLCDYVLANGGYNTILSYVHPVMLLIPNIVIVVAFIWIAFNAIVLAANRKWVKSGILAACIAFALIGARITIGILAERSERKAYDIVTSFFAGDNISLSVKVDSEVENSYRAFASSFDQSAISLLSSYPPHGRYNFLVRPKAAESFMVTLWVEDNRAKVWVTKQWDKRQ